MVPSEAIPPLDGPTDADGVGPFGRLPGPPAGLADRLERATSRRVRRRAWRRRASVALAVAAAYVAGVLTPGWIATGGSPHGAPGPNTDARTTSLAEPTLASMDASAMSRALRERGDRLLAEAGDVMGALLCYREHLELASLVGRPVPDDADSWLLSAMKNEFR